MQIDHHQAHLTYCSNIHPGESWEATYSNLKNYTTKVGKQLGVSQFGIGLRLSDAASKDLSQKETLDQFKNWLGNAGLYVFTINGFPFGGFHHQVVKDKVHLPDWTSPDRLAYTKRLFGILSQLLPEGMDGGVSTSPLSYKFWHDESQREAVKKSACDNLMQVVIQLDTIYQQTGKLLHLDIEPEPDGILETSAEFVKFYRDYLLKQGVNYLTAEAGFNNSRAEEAIRRHIQLCYDVCHFAVGYENAADVLLTVAEAGIEIGRIQISAAMSSGRIDNDASRSEIIGELKQFDEPVYLHQAVLRTAAGALHRFPDLSPALAAWSQGGPSELRTHFHVPVFTREYGKLISTQPDIMEVLSLWKQKNFTNHLEVETYTWDVLPRALRSDIVESIVRELRWVLNALDA